MSFNGKVKKDEKVVLIDNKTAKVLYAYSQEDKEFQWGGSAMFDVGVLKGAPGVEQMRVNVNFWDVYRLDDPALGEELVKVMFKMGNREPKENN